MRLLKCYGDCGNKYEKDKLKSHGGKNYCEKCYESKVSEYEERGILYGKIKDYYGVTFPTKFHLAQIKRIKDNGYSYKDMYLALEYCKKELKMNFDPTMGFGWVENKLEESILHYKNKEDNDKKFENVFGYVQPQVEKVKVKLDDTNTFRQSKLIKLEDLR